MLILIRTSHDMKLMLRMSKDISSMVVGSGTLATTWIVFIFVQDGCDLRWR